ncbi:VanZ family protein [Terrisporobacter petrolearius]|uniref:VanZ family protein n=1 Tax=Terrisporobacter petrolearius TaxID=1460447 RepID=UPI001D15F244|nr:VanZ family protein [Terrisporobacter petrolearius]MCC3863153.1 VanZ family protein [Terrisporobacter petrolearius]
MNFLIRGISEFIIVIPLALIIFSPYFLYIKYVLKIKKEWNSVEILCEFLWLLMLLAILNITGIIGSIVEGNFSVHSFRSYIDLNILSDGLSLATILNIILFIPFGFFTIMVFKKFATGVFMGFFISISIEVLQLFTGRFVQLEDILMNTSGMVIGCLLAFLVFKLQDKGYITIDS